MNAIRILCRRDLRSWLSLPAFFMMGAGYLLVTGIVFWVFAVTMGGRGLMTTEITFNGMLFWMAFLALASAVSVKLLGDEQERGTLELLLTAPVSEVEVVLAKAGAGFILILLLAIPAVIYPWILKGLYPGWRGVDPGMWLSGVLILVLLAGLLTLTGMVWSQLLRRQTSASVATFLTGAMLVFRGSLRSWIGGGADEASAGLMAVASHISSFAVGLIDSRALVFYLSGMAILLFVNIRLLQWARYRRTSGALNVAVSLVLVLLLGGLVNYLAVLHPVRIDVSAAGNSPLPGVVVKTLDHVKKPVQLILLSPDGDPVAILARRVVEKYRFAHPLLHVEMVDQSTDLSRTRDLVNQFKIRQPNVLIVSCGTRQQVLPIKDLERVSPGETRPDLRGATPGAALETELIAALQSVVQEKGPVVYFLTGHDERRIDDFSDFSGYSGIAGMIRERQAEVRALLLASAESVPEDCAALVIAGPARPLADWEVGKIRDYLARSGRLMVLVDSGSHSGLDALLEEWGIRLGEERIRDSKSPSLLISNAGRSPAVGMGEVPVIRYGRHPITDNLDGLVTSFYVPRPVELLFSNTRRGSLNDHADRPRVIELAFSSGKSWAEADRDQNPPRFNEGYDRPGPLSLAVCVEKGLSSELAMDIKPVRLVVCGDSQFAANACLAGANEAFFINALEWLQERGGDLPRLAAAGGIYNLRIESGDRLMAFFLTVGAMPLLLTGLGCFVAFSRRDRRANHSPFRKERAPL
jgi:ABC-type transport system involved in multi-copper enzyme maturation permease subunit